MKFFWRVKLFLVTFITFIFFQEYNLIFKLSWMVQKWFNPLMILIF